MTLIVKHTHCPDNTCQGEFTRLPFNIKGDLFFADRCDTCNMRKLTHAKSGDMLYLRGNKAIAPFSTATQD